MALMIDQQQRLILSSINEGYPFLSPSITLNMSLMVGRLKEKATKIDDMILKNELTSLLDTRDFQIINALLKGYTGRQTAEHLFIAQSTLATRLSNLFQSFGVESRTALITKLIKENYVLTYRKPISEPFE